MKCFGILFLNSIVVYNHIILVDENTNVLEEKLERFGRGIREKYIENELDKTEFVVFMFKNVLGGSRSDSIVRFGGQLIKEKQESLGLVA